MPRDAPLQNRPPLPGHGARVENYTNAFLVSAGGLLFMCLVVIWTLWGLLAVFALLYGTDKLISHLSARRSG